MKKNAGILLALLLVVSYNWIQAAPVAGSGPGMLLFQAKDSLVTGIVTDQDGGTPIPGVTIKLPDGKGGVSTDAKGLGARMDAELSKLAGEPGFSGKTLGDLVDAEARATAATLAKNGCPVRTIHLPRIDEASRGELLMHFMLETIIMSHLLGVDPFDQPAVEEAKVLAKKYLAAGA